MLDLKTIREHTESVKEGIRSKGEDPARIDEILTLDEKRRQLVQHSESLKSRKNTVSADVAALKAKKEDATALIEDMRAVADEIKTIDTERAGTEERLRAVLLTIPNIPHPSVPIGRGPAENKVIAEWGDDTPTDSALRPHWELMEKLKIIDFARGTKITGAGFPVYVGKGARLERALINFFLDEAGRRGYTELLPPLMVNAASATGTGQLPDKEDQMYVVTRDEFYLVPTAEVPVTNFLRDEIIREKDLPVRFCAYTPCFRREAGSYGKDVRGLNRVHQFNKVELVRLVHPRHSYDDLEEMRGDAESLLRTLGLRYRVLLMCTGDLGFTQAMKYDLEVAGSLFHQQLRIVPGAPAEYPFPS